MTTPKRHERAKAPKKPDGGPDEQFGGVPIWDIKSDPKTQDAI